jgi:hypothetical protein
MTEQSFLVPLATTVAWGTDRDEWFAHCLDDASVSRGRFEFINDHVEVTGYIVHTLGPILCFFAMVPKEAACLLQIWGIPNFYDDGRKEDWSRAYVMNLWEPKG